MADLHIADFYKDVARIFIQLYASFPRKIILYVEDICGPDSPDEFGLHCPRFQACFSTMVWLSEAGYLQYESNIRQEALDQVVLSQRGFTLLFSRAAITQLPPTLADEIDEPYPSNISVLRHALKYGTSTTLEQVVQSLLAASTPS
jgi:hypothetical protein